MFTRYIENNMPGSKSAFIAFYQTFIYGEIPNIGIYYRFGIALRPITWPYVWIKWVVLMGGKERKWFRKWKWDDDNRGLLAGKMTKDQFLENEFKNQCLTIRLGYLKKLSSSCLPIFLILSSTMMVLIARKMAMTIWVSTTVLVNAFILVWALCFNYTLKR